MVSNIAAKVEIMEVLVKYNLVETDAVSVLEELLEEIKL